jgi:hypothetical protein
MKQALIEQTCEECKEEFFDEDDNLCEPVLHDGFLLCQRCADRAENRKVEEYEVLQQHYENR